MKKFYAFEMTREDNDWGFGSNDWNDAVEFLISQHNDGNDDALVATIAEGSDPTCIAETAYADLDI